MKRGRINNNGEVIDYEIVHRPAVTRRLHLELGDNGLLQVVAPRRWSRRAIHSTLQQKAHRVARFLVDARVRQQEMPVFNYADGEKHLFLGRKYPLSVREVSGKRTRITLSEGRLIISFPPPARGSIQKQLEGWYRQQAAEFFTERLAVFSQCAAWTGGNVPVMRLRKMKRTWGSCSAKGVITLNPHLVKAPEECIDYVIAHEICHLREHNHGPAFYALQEQLYPGWREAKNQLRNEGHIYLL